MCRTTNHVLSWIPCHRRGDRSFYIKGRKLPLCARCTSILLGYLSVPVFLYQGFLLPWYWILILTLPMLIDGYTQLWKWRESSNTLRFLTGLSFGIGQALLISLIVLWLTR